MTLACTPRGRTAYEPTLFTLTGIPCPVFRGAGYRTIASYGQELAEHRGTEIRLRGALARDEALLRQKDELLNRREILRREADHRLMNGLQTVVSLLSLQSRGEANAQAAAHLSAAANRVATIPASTAACIPSMAWQSRPRWHR